MGLNRNNGLPRTVERRPDQIIHGRIDDGKIPVFGALQEFHPGHQNARIRGNGAARLEHQLQLSITHAFIKGFHIICRLRRGFLVVGHTQTAPHIQMANTDALLCQGVDQRKHPVQGIQERRN